MSPISYSKDWEADMISSMEVFSFDSALDLNMGYYDIKPGSDAQKLCTIVFTWHMRKYKYNQSLTLEYQKIFWFLIFFKNSCLSLSKMLRPILMIVDTNK
jgi:hypothetical protein